MNDLDFETFKTKAQDISDRCEVVKELLKEANTLFSDPNNQDLTDGQYEERDELGAEIAHHGNFLYGGDGTEFWLPSTC